MRKEKSVQQKFCVAINSILFWTVVICLCAPATWALTIATGPNDGSYYQIAQDIKAVAAKDNVDVQVMATKGSLENIDLLASGKVDTAIVQLDALRFVSDVLKQQKGVDLFQSVKVRSEEHTSELQSPYVISYA